MAGLAFSFLQIANFFIYFLYQVEKGDLGKYFHLVPKRRLGIEKM
jgi:hypothetical protein